MTVMETAKDFFRRRLVELSSPGIMEKINQVVDIDIYAKICDEYYEYKTKGKQEKKKPERIEFIKYSDKMTEDVFNKIIQDYKEKGFTWFGSFPDYNGFKKFGYCVFSHYLKFIQTSTFVKKNDIEVYNDNDQKQMQ